MKKKTAKKLTLSRETLHALVNKSLEDIRGGTSDTCTSFVFTNCPTCQTRDCA